MEKKFNMNLLSIKFSAGVEEEILERLHIMVDEEGDEDYTRADAIVDVFQDSADPDMPAHEYRREINGYLIAMGVYEEVTQEQLDQTITLRSGRSRKAAPDLRYNKRMYSFTSWEPLEEARKIST